MLEVKNLHVEVDGHAILRGINFKVESGTVHAIMGPNGSGKSTLSKVLAGHPSYAVTRGEILYKGKNLAPLTPDERAKAGIFMSFQYPVEIPGVTNISFLKSAVNSIYEGQKRTTLDAVEFLSFIRKKCQLLEMDESFLYRGINEGFSGGEKKRNEILQMLALEPTLAILDETDSGLDIDALRVIATGVNAMRSPERAIVLVTHYQRLLNYIEPDFIHVLADGKIVKSGDKSLALELEAKGYNWIAEVEQS